MSAPAVPRTTVSLRVNGEPVVLELDARTTLVELVRDALGLTGAHVGCATGNCGACTVLLDGHTVKSCSVLAADAVGTSVVTIEALSESGETLHPIQQAFVENQGLQCGYCTPGMILSTLYLLRANADPTADEVRRAIAGNLCRCTGYHMIVDSILDAAKRVRAAGAPLALPGE